MHYLLLFSPLLGLLLFFYLAWQVALPLYLFIIIGSFGLYWKIIRAQRRRPLTGQTTMIGGQGLVVMVKDDKVEVEYQGEIWQASSSQPLHQGQPVVIERVEGLLLRVAPLAPDG
jgi:membrane-bound serine protease (ClpP class)